MIRAALLIVVLGQAAAPTLPDQSSAALFEAATYGRADNVSRLLAAGATPNVFDADGLTPLMIAAGQGHLAVVRALLDAGASTGPNGSGLTALMFAASSNRADIVGELLARGANVNAKARDGATAALAAAYGGHVEVMGLLASAHADLAISDGERHTILMAAAQSGSRDTVAIVLASRPQIDALDAGGTSALTYSAAGRQFDVAEMLIDAGAALGRENVMHAAAQAGNLRIVRLLMDRGLGVDARDGAGATPLMSAISGRKSQVVEYLISEKANVNATDQRGETPLMRAADAGDTALVKRLLASGASPAAVDASGRTAWNHAVLSQSPEAAALLTKGRDSQR